MESEKTQRKTGTKATNYALIFILAFSLCATVLLVNTPKAHADVDEYSVCIEGDVSDGYGLRIDGSFNTAWNGTVSEYEYPSNPLLVSNYYQTGNYKMGRGYMLFDTSSLQVSANVTNATLSFVPYSVGYLTFYLNDYVCVQSSSSGTYPHSPFVEGDYYRLHYGSDGNDTIGEISFNTLNASIDSYVNVTLGSDFFSSVNTDDFTGVILRLQSDINGTATADLRQQCLIYDTEEGVGYMPLLYLTYTVEYNLQMNLYGPYDELGTPDYDGINCTLFRQGETTQFFELNVTDYRTAINPEECLLIFDISENMSRTYYFRYDQWYENIYVFYPDEIYNTYFITLVDFVGFTNGYLETMLYVNGTNRIIERQRIDTVNDIPFILSWGTSYQFRIVADEGTYTWDSIIAGADTTLNLIVSRLNFPLDSIHISNITLSATRVTDTIINVAYADDANLTEWLYISITPVGESSSVYSTNVTGYTHDMNWSSAVPSKSYVVYFDVGHEEENELTYNLVTPSIFSESNPFNFAWLGSWFGVDTTQILGVIIVFATFGAFSRGSVEVGIVAMLITAGILIIIGFLDIPVALFITVFCLALIAIIGLRKEGGNVT